MGPIDSKSLIFSPLCSWVNAQPRIFFNAGIIAEGESFKILVYTPSDDDKQNPEIESDFFVNIRSLNKEGESKNKVFEGLSLKRVSQTRLALGISTGQEQTLVPGAYIAQVVSSRYEEIVNEHRFYVATQGEYYEIWRSVFGDQWDEPIYWDQFKKGQGDELLRGFPTEQLLVALPQDFEWNANSLYQFLGHLITLFMINQHGHLPFEVVCDNETPPENFPHVDLTKLIWLLNVLGSVLTDMFFLSTRNRISVSASSNGVYIDISRERSATRYEWSEFEIRTNDADIQRAQPVLFDVIREFVGKDLAYKVYSQAESHIHIGMFSKDFQRR